MSEVVIEVGPATIAGPNDVRPERVSAALDCIDDEIALLDDRPVSVQDLWDDVMGAVAGTGVDTMVLVCPAWWSSARIDRTRRAAHTVAAEVVLLERIAALREGISAETTIVEITSDVAVVTVSGRIAAVVPRQGEFVADAEAVVAAVGAPAGVLVDAPVAVSGRRTACFVDRRSHARDRRAGQDRRRRMGPARGRGATITRSGSDDGCRRSGLGLVP